MSIEKAYRLLGKHIVLDEKIIKEISKRVKSEIIRSIRKEFERELKLIDLKMKKWELFIEELDFFLDEVARKQGVKRHRFVSLIQKLEDIEQKIEEEQENK